MCKDSYTVEVGREDFDLASLIKIEDDSDGLIPVYSSMIDFKNFDPSVLGQYKVLLSVSDSEGFPSSKELTIDVVDTTLPIVSSNHSINTVRIYIGPYLEVFYMTAEDNYDEDVQLITVGSVDSWTYGEYNLEYYAIDSSGNRSESVFKTMTVIAHTPYVQVTNLTSTQDSISFEIYMEDIDNTVEFTSIELYRGTELIESLTDLTLREFTNLQSDTKYKVIANYTINTMDGRGDLPGSKLKSETTLKNETPEVSLNSVSIVDTTLTFELDVNDANSIGEITTLELYKEGTLVDTLTDFTTMEFNNIEEGFNYTIHVIYTYDLNDGSSEQVVEDSLSLSTKVLENEILNGDFEDAGQISVWQKGEFEGGAAIVTITDGQLKIDITEVSWSGPASPRIHQAGLIYETGKTYIVTFDAYAETERKMQSEVGVLLDAAPWFVSYADPQLFNLTTEMQTFTFQFTVTEANTTKGVLTFELGLIDGESIATVVYLDNVTLQKLD